MPSSHSTETLLHDMDQFAIFASFVSIDEAKNRRRFYRLDWREAPFEGGAIVRSWGRIGGKGRTVEGCGMCEWRMGNVPPRAPTFAVEHSPFPITACNLLPRSGERPADDRAHGEAASQERLHRGGGDMSPALEHPGLDGTMTLQPTPCQECGTPITVRRTCKSKQAGLCSPCYKRLYDKVYRQAHKEHYNRYARRYYQANREKLRSKSTAQKRAWRAANQLHYREYQRDYKRRTRTNGSYPWEKLPNICQSCGEDISGRRASKARREGLCPRCYVRKAHAAYSHTRKARKAEEKDEFVQIDPLQAGNRGIAVQELQQ